MGGSDNSNRGDHVSCSYRMKLSSLCFLLRVLTTATICKSQAEEQIVSQSGTFIEDLLSVAYENIPLITNESTAFGFFHKDLILTQGVEGLGVFAQARIPADTVIEVSPAIMFPTVASHVYLNNQFTKNNRVNVLTDYMFPAPIENFSLIVLGWGMLYNHCKNENMGWKLYRLPERITATRKHHFTDLAVAFTTLRDIEENEEICWNYGDWYWSTRDHPQG
jgi:SET domain